MKKLPEGSKDIFEYFDGKWNISRNISNFLAPEYNGKADGQVIINKLPSSSDVSYYENVEITFDNGLKTNGTQEYIFQLVDGAISQHRFKTKTTKKSEKMYDLNFIENKEGLLAVDKYQCGDDLYQVKYFINSYDDFFVQYIVTGPKKNYITQTSFVRESIKTSAKMN